MNQHKTTPEAYRLLHEGAQALSRVEANGIRIDQLHLKTALVRVDKEVEEIEKRMNSTKEMGQWRRRFGVKTNPNSRDQMAEVAFNVLGHKPRGMTGTGKRFSANKEALEAVDIPFVRDFLRVQQLRNQVKKTYLHGILREIDSAGFIHPHFHLNTVQTYRSSCSEPNVQNLPNRDKGLAEIVRNCYIPRPGYRAAEIDYGQIEVRVAACHNSDPRMVAYIKDESKDMHYDASEKLFFLPRAMISKMVRHLGKNQFIFPEFYGSYFIDCAKAMWESILRARLCAGADGKGMFLLDHLAKHGIKELGACDPHAEPEKGTFEYHVREVERWLWNKMFPVYRQWRKDWWEQYLREGGFTSKTGFGVNAVLRKNAVLSYSIQGSSFHCLLRSMVLLQEWLNKKRMKSRIVNEVHDSMWLDLAPREWEDVSAKAREIMTVQVPSEWRWINVPLDVELEVAPTGKSWAEKKVLEF